MSEERDQQQRPRRRLGDVGGTDGGLGDFLVGLALLVAGAWLFLGRVVVTTGGVFAPFGLVLPAGTPFGVTLLPMFLGVMLLFWRGRSVAGWVLVAGGAVALVAGVMADLRVYFRPTTLPHTLVMFGLMAAGLGLVARALRPH
jgi:hypothetical protein